MTGALKRKETFGHRQFGHRMPREDGGRDWGEVSPSQGIEKGQ